MTTPPVTTEEASAVNAEPGVRISRGPAGDALSTWLELEFRPSSRVELSVEPSFDRSSQVRQ